MNHPSIRRRLMFGTGLAVTIVLIFSGVIIYKAIGRTLRKEIGTQLLHSASQLAKSSEMKPDGVVYEWYEAHEAANTPEVTGYFQFWDLASGHSKTSPELVDGVLPQFYGELNRPVIRMIQLPDGRPAMAVGLLHHPFLDDMTREEMKRREKVLDPVDFPQVLVCVRETRTFDDKMERMRDHMVKAGLATVAAVWLAVLLVTTWSLKPLGGLAGRLLERAGDSSPTVLEVPPDLPVELIGLAEAFNTTLSKIKAAEVELEAAELALNRAVMLLRDKVGSAKAVEEATAARDIANQGVKTARAKRELLGPPSLPVTSPAVVWIKVPVYVGLLALLDVAAGASVGGISGRPGEDARAARPVAAPPSARVATSTADLFYQVDNADCGLRPGQKVGIRIPMTESGESLVVPWSAVVYDVDGVADLKTEQLVLVPHIQIRLRPEAAANFGLTPAMVRGAANTLTQGTLAGQVYQDQKIVDVVVTGAPGLSSDINALRELLVSTPSGTQIPLGEVADIEILPTPNVIKHEGASRRIDVTCNVAGKDLGSVAREIEERVGTISFKRGYHPEFLGEYAARQASRKRLLSFSALALLGILVILHVDFRSLRLVMMTALTLPFALVGGVIAAWLGGGVLSIGSLVGFVTVLGIAARNGIMLISHYRHLEEEEGMEFGRELVLRGAMERLSPILMTAFCAGLALLPLVVAGDAPGHEIEHPLAVVIVGGLVTSTLLNLFIMPSLYAAFGRRKRVGGDPELSA